MVLAIWPLTSSGLLIRLTTTDDAVRGRGDEKEMLKMDHPLGDTMR